jgi:ABC-2 type transport system ATP-binding protein
VNVIEVSELVRKFGDFTAVKGVTFDVAQGEIFGFLGPNGAGKTTTINVLCTLLRPTAGRASVNGYDVMKDAGDVRQSIGPEVEKLLPAATLPGRTDRRLLLSSSQQR